MGERKTELRLVDIAEAVARIGTALDGISLDEFEADWQKRWIVERGLEIISEASRHLDPDMKARHQEIPWRKVAGIGNILRHAYEKIAADVLWALAQKDLAALGKVCEEELRGQG